MQHLEGLELPHVASGEGGELRRDGRHLRPRDVGCGRGAIWIDLDGSGARVLAEARPHVPTRLADQPASKTSWRGLRLAGAPEASFSARSCLRLPQAPANLGLSAAWAALTGPIGRVLDTGSGQHLNRFGPPALQLYKHLSNGEGGSVPGGGVPLLRDPEGYGRPIVERGARLCCENDPPMPPAVPQAATLPHVVLQNPDAFRR